MSFGPKSRQIGEPAKTAEISNLKNTISNLTRLAGRTFSDPDIAIEQEYISAKLVDVNGQVGAEVSYLGSKEKFSATQLIAMYFTQVKESATRELKLPVNDIVISCPAWYTDAQRRCLLDAAEIAGLKILRLINDTTAVALGWGITKTDLPTAEEKPKRIAFVDIGNANYTVSIAEFRKGELAIKSTVSDRHFGGRNFDKALVDHFAKEFKEKFKIDINENAKARFRVLAACEKLKKVLSANSNGPINIESLMNDVDVRGALKREELEEMLKPLLDRATKPLEQALAEAKLKVEDLDAIEMVGGCTRVPSLKTAIQNFFGRPLSFTLNQDEAVARGAAFSCAIHSPVFRVREFAVHDINNYPIEFTWEKSPDIPDEDTSLTVFNKGNAIPSTKILTFYRKQNFDLEAKYAKPEQLPGKISPWIGRFSVKGVKADAKDDFMICKLKARINPHGILNVEQGYYVEEQEVEEPVPDAKAEAEKKDGDVRIDSKPSTPAHDAERYDQARTTRKHDGTLPRDTPAKYQKKRESVDGTVSSSVEHIPTEIITLTDSQAMETDEKAPAAANGKKTRKVKKQVRKGDLPLVAGTASLDQESKNAAAEKENEMHMEDKLVKDTEDKKNELETFMYELRERIHGIYDEFSNEEEKEKISAKCSETEVCPFPFQYHNMIVNVNDNARTGSMKTAKTPQRPSMLPNTRNCAVRLPS